MGEIYLKYNDKALRPILKDIVDECEKNGLDIFDRDSVVSNYANIIEIVDGEIESYIGTPSNEDSTFFISIILINPNFMTEPIKRPELKTYRISHVYERIETIRTTYTNDYNSYLPFTIGMLEDLRSMGYYDPLDGDQTDEDYVDSDYTDDWVEDIDEI